jgi:glycosyltransferase involved in cell wall biosynthesis
MKWLQSIILYDLRLSITAAPVPMKRVLLTVHKFFPQHRAGTEVLTLKVAQQLQSRGYEVLVVTANPPDIDARYTDGPTTSDFVYEGVPVHVIEEPLRLKDNCFEHEFWNPNLADHFNDLLNSFRPDLVHSFHLQNLSASVIEVCNKRNLPIVCSTTDFWFVCPVVQLKRPDGAVCRGPKSPGANCLTCYTPRLMPSEAEFAEAVESKYPLIKALSRLPEGLSKRIWAGLHHKYTERKFIPAAKATQERPSVLREWANKTNGIMVPTKLMFDIFVENGIDSRLITHVPFGIDVSPLVDFQIKTQSDVLRIGFVGTLFEHKGVDTLIEAFQRLPADARAVLKIYGDTKQFAEYAETLIALAKRPLANSEKIQFLGTFPNDELGKVFTEIDVLVVPSRWYENTPLVMQSALATKTPLICTNLGGMSELVKPDFNGMLFELNSAESLAEKLNRFLQDPDLAGRLSSNIPPERTIAQMVENIEQVYSMALYTGTGPKQLTAAGEPVS